MIETTFQRRRRLLAQRQQEHQNINNAIRIMKTTIAALIVLAVAALTGCQNPADTQKVVAISQLGLDILVAKKVIKPEDAEIVKETGRIIITPAPTGK